MAFIESPRFPDCVSLGAQGGPGFLTEIVQVNGGDEYRNQRRAQELGSWEVSHNARRPEEYEPLQAMFRIAAGMANGFRFKDHLDYEVRAGQGFFRTLTATTFQMVKRYSLAGAATTYDRDITKPVSGTVSVTGGSGVSVDYTTGIVTVSSGTPTSWVGEFDIPARFGVDQMKAVAVTRVRGGEILVDWSSIPIIEIRP
jgi:uncharacterized protein (TIGR02217 family)